jgi:hypothetical protein
LLGRSKSDPDLDIAAATSMEMYVSRRRRVLAAVDGELVNLPVPLKFDLNTQALLVLEPQIPEEACPSRR